jgi:hypothetical protein
MLAVAAVVCLAIGAGSARASDPCDRTCLEKHLDSFLAALTARDFRPLPLARDVRSTENGQALRLGDGFWRTASARGKYKLYVTDADSGQIGYFGTIIENGTPVLMALRLKVEEQLISEIEMLVTRPNYRPGGSEAGAGRRMEEAGQPRPQFVQTVPAAEQMSREDLTRIANSYFMGLANNSVHYTAPFWDTCERWENGNITTGRPRKAEGFDVLALGCRGQQESGFFSFVTSIRNRRFPVVDRERGLVLAWAFFDHSGAGGDVHLNTGQTMPSPVTAPLTYHIAELFQVRQGKIDQIEAVCNTVPYGMKNDNWDK